jgi:carboxyl-terminal processing protease
MRFLLRGSLAGLTGLLLTAPLSAQTAAPATAGSIAAPVALPAAASSASGPNEDAIDLDDVRRFSRVYEVVRQAYVEKVDNKTLMDAAISGMLSQLDPHSAYLDKEGLQQLSEDTTGQYSGLGIEVLQTDGGLHIVTPIDDTPAARAGIQPGDDIVKINGTTIDPQNVDAMFKQLRGEPGSKIRLTIVHANSDKPIDLELVRENIAIASVKTRQLEPGYAYIRLTQFQSDTAADLEKKLAELLQKTGPLKGAVLDLRNNPGGLLTAAVSVSDDLLDAGVIVTTRGRLPDANLRFAAHPGDLLDGAPLVVLVNNGTASAAEIVSGALKDNHRALIIGQRTFGKGVVQTVLPLDADHAVKITTARYYTPNGTSIQAKGITPDSVLADLAVRTADRATGPVNFESDLPHHLANEKAVTSHGDTADEEAKLATQDFALSQALNVLKGMSLNRAAVKPAR